MSEDVKALIAEARRMTRDAEVGSRVDREVMLDRLADALESALAERDEALAETEWEYGWAPILSDGEELPLRPEAECDDLIAAHADPAHWVHDERNDGLSYVVGKRRYRRRASGPWEVCDEQALQGGKPDSLHGDHLLRRRRKRGG